MFQTSAQTLTVPIITHSSERVNKITSSYLVKYNSLSLLAFLVALIFASFLGGRFFFYIQ